MDRIQRSIDYIEGHLGGDLDVERLAAVAAYSPYHFCRMFQALTGWSLMRYVNHRRLSVAATRLTREDVRLIDLAFDSGFASQAAFTRAFKRKFGVSPGRFKAQCDAAIDAAIDGRPIELTATGLEPSTVSPRFLDLPAFRAVGLKGRFEAASAQNIGALWQTFAPMIETIAGAVPGVSYGICYPPEPVSGLFDYYAAVAVTEAHPLPQALEALEIPAQHYAVFTHQVSGPDIGAGLIPTQRYIWQDWLPGSGYQFTGGPDFELYDDRFDASGPAGAFDIYVPVAKAT